MNCFAARWLLVSFLLTIYVLPARATHIVGGEVTYKWLGGNSYQVRLDIYQDCFNGDIHAILQDNPAIISIFTGNGVLLLVDSIAGNVAVQVPSNFNNACINNPPHLCLNKQSFIKTYSLPPSTTGYYIVHQRCCRNISIINIADPGITGGTYYAIIPPGGNALKPNNSAVFRNYPPQIICINSPLVYDHAATDVDGDSLSYEFCTAYEGGSSTDAKPVPLSINFTPVQYVAGCSVGMPMLGYPTIQIDSKTGLITGTPNLLGRFVVAVCCHEWRNGVMINTVTREFQFVVTNCSKAVEANIPKYSDQPNTYIVQCDGYTVPFDNLSTGANSSTDAYSWDFGVPGILSDTSHLKNPQYAYPDTGVYVVTLVVNRNSTCVDSIARLVKIYPEFHADFDLTGPRCPKSPIQFINKSSSTYQPVFGYAWTFGDGATTDTENPRHTYELGGAYTVTLSAANAKGCADTVNKTIDIQTFRPFAGNDTIIVKGEHILFNASGGDVYRWRPPDYLDNPDIRNPIGYYPDTTHVAYVVHIATEAGCEGEDTVNVWVVNQEAIFVPSAFSPNGDGRNDILRPVGIGYGRVNYFRVFNRWGQGVFYGTHFNEGWDGSYQGHAADIGSYFWELSVTDRFGKELKLKGDATLVK